MDGSYSLPSSPHPHASNHGARKPQRIQVPFLRNQSRVQQEGQDSVSNEVDQVRMNGSSRQEKRWWKVRLFRGMVNDIRRRVPYYWSDWKDAWDYRVVPATIYMYFAKYGPESACAL